MIKKIKAFFNEKFDTLFASLVLEIRERSNILQTEIGSIHKKLDEKKELYEKIVKLEEEVAGLERDKQSLEDVAEDANREYEETKEKWESLNKAFKDLEKDSDNMGNEYFEREKRFSEKLNEQRSIIAQLEHKAKDTEVALKDATERNVEAQAKQERLLTLAKEYDKATVSMLNAVLERKSATEERKAWEAAKGALKGWDSPVAKKRGRKKQS